MVDVPTVSILIASAGVLAGVIYYVLELRHQSQLRQTESVIRLSPYFTMNAREMQEAVTQLCSVEYEDYEDYVEKYSEKSEHLALKVLGNYFEGIGILVYRKLVNPDVIYDFWGGIIESSWQKVEPLVADMRKDTDDPNMFRFWEYLYYEMKKREARKPGEPTRSE